MKICDFTRREVEYFRQECNFTSDEMALFEMRANNIPLEECAERMNVSISTAKRISQRVNNKIIRVY